MKCVNEATAYRFKYSLNRVRGRSFFTDFFIYKRRIFYIKIKSSSSLTNTIDGSNKILIFEESSVPYRVKIPQLLYME